MIKLSFFNKRIFITDKAYRPLDPQTIARIAAKEAVDQILSSRGMDTWEKLVKEAKKRHKEAGHNNYGSLAEFFIQAPQPYDYRKSK